MEDLVNKVASSGLMTIDLEEYVDRDTPRRVIDIKDQLYNGLILKESDFRNFIKNENWSAYDGHYIGVHCSNDAIIPTWAYMLLASKLEPFAKKIVFGDQNKLTEDLFMEQLAHLDASDFDGAKVVIKGCGDYHIPESCYMAITLKLAPVVSSLMYGEPCSTVPILKNRKKK